MKITNEMILKLIEKAEEEADNNDLVHQGEGEEGPLG